MDILEQLESRINATIQALEGLQLEKMQLQEDLDQAQQVLRSQEEEIQTLRLQNQELEQSRAQLDQQQNDASERMAAMMGMLDVAINEASTDADLPQQADNEATANDAPVDQFNQTPDAFA